jgi:hypothetical protein
MSDAVHSILNYTQSLKYVKPFHYPEQCLKLSENWFLEVLKQATIIERKLQDLIRFSWKHDIWKNCEERITKLNSI